MSTHLTSVDNYPLRVRMIALGVIVVLTVALKLYPRFDSDRSAGPGNAFEDLVEDINIPETRQLELPPPPPRPSIPIESEDEDLAQDITIEETVLNEFESWEAPPMLDNDRPDIRFIPYDEPPTPIGGYAAILSKLVYPEFARRAGIEGTVILRIFVSRKGFVEEIIVEKGLPDTGLDEAAIRAVKQVRFKPAKQRDRPLGVWLTIPIRFKLSGMDDLG
ncbi:MAG: energy transducer TonB [Candidatus Neomarinimicrobiota bacterium]